MNSVKATKFPLSDIELSYFMSLVEKYELPLCEKVIDEYKKFGRISASFLTRKFKITHCGAKKIISLMQRARFECPIGDLSNWDESPLNPNAEI